MREEDSGTTRVLLHSPSRETVRTFGFPPGWGLDDPRVVRLPPRGRLVRSRMRKALCAIVALIVIPLISGVGMGQESDWTEMVPDVAPSARGWHDMAYDSESDRVVLFGGIALQGDVLNDETWAYDLDSNAWERGNPTQRPSSRWAHAMAYDSESDRVVLYGGLTATGQSNETWAYDYSTNTWTNLTPAISPPAAVYVEMAYDAESDRVVLFGGGTSRFPATHSAETWAYDLDSNRWTRMNPSAFPAGRGVFGMAYDWELDRIVLFGGRDEVRDFDDTWAYDYNTDTWTQMSPVTAPSARHAVAMAYADDSGQVFLFGGFTVSAGRAGADETWAYNLDADAWRLVDKGSGPSRRQGATMAYDSESEQIVLFGGSSGGDDTWSFRFVQLPGPDGVPPWLWIVIAVGTGAVVLLITVYLVRGRIGRES